MSEAPDPGPVAETAGSLLRKARQAKGLHIAALAASIKVVPRKLELLESDQLDQLPDATFARALAQTVCRTLKVDAAPILQLLPPPSGQRLEQVGAGLNTPFRERPGRMVPADWSVVRAPVLWVALLLLVAAGVLYVLPSGWLALGTAPVPKTPAAATALVGAAPPVVQPGAGALAPPAAATAASTPAAAGSAASGAASDNLVVLEPEALAAATAAGVLQLRATAQSWVEVTDASGQSLISRVLEPGETVGLDGALPLKLTIGNAVATQVVFRGQPMELASRTRDNVARLELK